MQHTLKLKCLLNTFLWKRKKKKKSKHRRPRGWTCIISRTHSIFYVGEIIPIVKKKNTSANALLIFDILRTCCTRSSILYEIKHYYYGSTRTLCNRIIIISHKKLFIAGFQVCTILINRKNIMHYYLFMNIYILQRAVAIEFKTLDSWYYRSESFVHTHYNIIPTLCSHWFNSYCLKS